MNINDLLDQFNKLYGTNRDKGTKFEEVMKDYLLIDPLYSSEIEKVWMWKDFPYQNSSTDLGIDLVAKTYTDEYWAIQCKFYDSNYVVSKADVDTFLATSSKYFYVNGVKTQYSNRIIISTTDKYGKNAEHTLANQIPAVTRITMNDLLESPIDWGKFALNEKLVLKDKYTPKPHQQKAIDDVINGFKNHDRGKLIMACGTGKTFTSLRCVEKLLNGKGNVLFLVPSIALINQTLTEWSAQVNYSFNALVVCSDNKASKGDDSIDLKIPSTTNVDRVKNWYKYTIKHPKNFRFIFSTYQSIEVVSQLQKEVGINFNIIICDEAHRTTGVTLASEDDSNFVKVHDNDFIKADKRLYMTATPKVFGDNVKTKAKETNAVLCSMDDEAKFGPEFHNLTFSKAIKQNLLTDYKVLVLAVDEEYVKKELQDLLTDENHELKLEDSVKIMGCWKGLSKKSLGNDDSFLGDFSKMKRAVAFCNRIQDSKTLVDTFNLIQSHVKENDPLEANDLVDVEIKHVDGNFNALQKKERINWLKEDTQENTCRILTNARCLSEGVDVPSLDAVMFLNPRSSIVDIIQSVGRVMRKSKGKQYGYILLPIGVSANEDPADALDNNKKYEIVWTVLNALRSHDDRFNNTINKIDLNKKKPDQINVIGIGDDKNEDLDNIQQKKQTDNYQLTLNFTSLEQWKDSIYAKMVKRVGSRKYWEKWAKDVAQIAQTHIDRINILLNKNDPYIDKVFTEFLDGLRINLNPSISKEDAIEMLSQHLITKPVFDALFDKYEFVNNNPVSKTMQKMMDILDAQALNSEKEKLNNFYNDVKDRAAGIDNAEGKQKIIIELYDKFFKTALPKEVEKLGIVYTPTECVDFIINSVEYLMQQEFHKSLSDKNVHIIDGFTGTGTFIVRLLQSGIIKKEDLLYKYMHEIHANEIVLLAYYIAAINIEETFHFLSESKEYVPFEGIVLTDTFQLYEDWNEHEVTQYLKEQSLQKNTERAKKQRELPITIAISNPPYSVGQKSSDDNAQNLKYENLDNRLNKTYVKYSKTSLRRNLYDSYVRAFRWASDRVSDNGIIGFITNGSYLDNQSLSGMRKCFVDEFTSIYVFNLRGNQRTSGEISKKEGGKIFGSGSRAPIAMTFLVKNKNKKNDNFIHYYDIGDYLTRQQKLDIIKEKHDCSSLDWKIITPDENNDWINKKKSQFAKFEPMAPKKKEDLNTSSIFTNYIIGAVSSRDAWVYNFSNIELKKNVNKTIEFYNSEVSRLKNDSNKEVKIDKKSISWSRALKNKAKRGIEIEFDNNAIVQSVYRPFCKQNYYTKDIIESPGKGKQLFMSDNKIICVSGVGANKSFSALMLDSIPCLDIIEKGQCFPLYWFEKSDDNLFGENLIKHEGISDKFLKKCINKYRTKIDKKDIFYYIYGILHCPQYKNEYEADLKKSLPCIPIVDSFDDFWEFSNSGKALANLHLNYEKVEIYDKCSIIMYKSDYTVEKMKFDKKAKKSVILYNDYIKISNIPLKAYEYIINGKSAIEWIMERYAITIDKKSGIVNNPNDWCKETNDPMYVFNLLLKVINISVQTVDIIQSLPKISFE